MPELAVAILASDDEQRTLLQMLVDGSGVARTVHSYNGYPLSATDIIVRRIQDQRPDVVVVDIPARESSGALRALELLHSECPKGALFAVGELSQPQTIVAAMRAGAREFVERPTSATSLLEAFLRVTTAQRKGRSQEQRGKLFTVLNAKGGSGATTVAVNTALALHSAAGNTVLVDLAPMGHSALHLNIQPTFTISDAIRNLHRLDMSLLESFMVRHPGGLQLLAGSTTPYSVDPGSGELARLFDLLVANYGNVVVDASGRLDSIAHLVCELSDLVMIVVHTDVISLWSAAQVVRFLNESGANTERIRLILNRYRKISGFTEADAEAAAGAKLLWKIPNQYPAVSTAIDRGTPVVMQNHTEVARSFAGLATALRETGDTKHRSWSIFKTTA